MEGKYYELKCPYCESVITNNVKGIQTFEGHSYFVCSSCKKRISLYQILSYNMWLAENHKVTKVSEKPILFEDNKNYFSKIMDIKEQLENSIKDENFITINPYISFIFEQEDEDDEEMDFGEDSSNAERVANICYNQYIHLLAAGFSRSDSISILKALINNDNIIFGGDE